MRTAWEMGGKGFKHLLQTKCPGNVCGNYLSCWAVVFGDRLTALLVRWVRMMELGPTCTGAALSLPSGAAQQTCLWEPENFSLIF